MTNLLGMYIYDPQTGWFVGEMGTTLTITELPFETLYLPLVIHEDTARLSLGLLVFAWGETILPLPRTCGCSYASGMIE